MANLNEIANSLVALANQPDPLQQSAYTTAIATLAHALGQLGHPLPEPETDTGLSAPPAYYALAFLLFTNPTDAADDINEAAHHLTA